MNMIKNSSGSLKAATTTEELIVQYLDGELVRKELETVLFERLAQSDEARTLLREYLVVRGAISQSKSSERFQLSRDLDGRTRRRIEQMFERIDAEGFNVVFPATGAEHAPGFLPDRVQIATNPFTRRMKQWSLRTSLAALALLLAVGTTWFVTRTTDEHSSAQITMRTPNPAVGSVTSQTPVAPLVTESSVAKVVPQATHFRSARVKNAVSEPALAASVAPHSAVAKPPQAPAIQPAAQDVMISDRFGKAIESAKHEVVISDRDRL